MTDVPLVPWLIGTKKSFARSLALVLAAERKLKWASLTHAQRKRLTDEATQRIDEWLAANACKTFLNEWREPLEGQHDDRHQT